MKKQRALNVIQAMVNSIRDLLIEQAPEMFEAYDKAEKEAMMADKNFSFPVAVRATITPKGADHKIKTEIGWSVKHTVSVEQVVTDQRELFDDSGDDDEGETGTEG